MPRSVPSEPLREALEGIGVSGENQERRTLRTLVHQRTGVPPPDHTSADELARTLLRLEFEKQRSAPAGGSPAGPKPA